MYLAEEQYDEEEKDDSSTDCKDDDPQWYSSWLLYLNVRKRSRCCLQQSTTSDVSEIISTL